MKVCMVVYCSNVSRLTACNGMNYVGNALWSAMSHGASKPKEEQLVATPLTPKATTPKSGKRVKRGKSAMAGKKEEEELDQLKVPVVKSPRLSIANGGVCVQHSCFALSCILRMSI